MKRRFLFMEATATLVGTIIGAGILGIPYVVAKAGFWTGIANIAALGAVVMLLYLYLGEVVLRTNGNHQLTGYAKLYLGKWGKRLMAFSMIAGNYGALVAYILGVGAASAAIVGGNPWLYSLIFFAIVSLIVFLGLNAVGESELFMQPIIAVVVIGVSVIALLHLEPANLTSFDASKIFIPYGVILFAFLGAVAVPEMREELRRNEKLMKKAIIAGVLIPIAAYLLFAFAIVGVTGLSTTEIATVGLGERIGESMVIIGNILAVLTMSTSFLTLALSLRETYQYDYKLSPWLSWALTCFVPLLIALTGITTFIKVIGFSGIIAGGMEGILIVLMAVKAKKLGKRKPEYSIRINPAVAAVIIALFVAGAGYYLWSMI